MGVVFWTVSPDRRAMPLHPVPDAMIFDCDGVLVDSETIVNTVLRDEVERLGWSMSLEECIGTFMGSSLAGVLELVHRRTGTAVSGDWVQTFTERRDAALEESLAPIPGAARVVEFARHHFGGRIACASNSDPAKIRLQLNKTGLLDPFDGKIFSAFNAGAPKPDPAVFLAAAAAMNPPSTAALILEDSPSGVQAGKAAGATVIGLLTSSDEPDLKAAGADLIAESLGDVPELIRSLSATR
ncbi:MULTISPECIES: HAD family phosphatase [Arthrobacter]|uniref:HAD family phosphatase n=2 Tax=Arthrobacter TaxID=1663 RepID=A0ABU9KHL7_9MICC|nr:HAD family phosphatase [Arthrobacter sp. YJM1]MDP5226594.1 HAD family phosphatase [Arthrobacter sp. YJM1]